MSIDEVSVFIAYWGAVLSTLLAVIKILEFWRDRFRIDVSYSFSTNESTGNKILIRNLSSHPIIIEYWEVLYCSGFWPHQEFEAIVYADYFMSDRRVEAHSTLDLSFTEQHYFKTLKGKKIFIRIHVAGRRPILRKIYP